MLIVVPVTALYAGLYALLLLVLAAAVSRQRRSLKVGLGHGSDDPTSRSFGCVTVLATPLPLVSRRRAWRRCNGRV